MTDDQILGYYDDGNNRPPLNYLYRKSPWRNSVRDKMRWFKISNDNFDVIFSDTITRFDRAIFNRSYKGNSTLEKYFMGICHNVCKDFLEAKIKRRDAMENYIPLADARRAEEINGPEWREPYDRVRPVLDKLPEKKRKYVQLYMAGYGHESIAEELDYKNAVTARNTFQRIIDSIREVVKLFPFLFSLIC